MHKKLILSHNKGLNKGDYLIDDHIDEKGQENFEGELLHFGSDEFSDWEAVNPHYSWVFVMKSQNANRIGKRRNFLVKEL